MMMKKLMMVVGGCLLAAGVAQAESVSCLDYDAATGSFTNAVRECTLFTAETRTLADGWYAVQGTVTIPEGANLTVNGTAHLILCDGASLTVNGEDKCAGIEVLNDNALSVYGQAKGTGQLMALGGSTWAAGIGGGDEGSSGKVTINGGTVVATGGKQGAGIGGGVKGSGGNVTINGGTVTATGGDWAAGIGGGYDRAGGTVTINGGTVTATGGNYGAGIGGGYDGAGGKVTINGGTVTAKGGLAAAGIGGGQYASGGTVTINGGRLKVVAGSSEASVIGAGYAGASHGSVAITSGLFSWKPNEGWYKEMGSQVFVNHDASTCADYPWIVLPAVCVTFERTIEHTTAIWTCGDGSVTNAISGSTFFVPKGVPFKVLFALESSAFELVEPTVYESKNGIWDDLKLTSEQLPTVRVPLVEYVDADGSVKSCDNYDAVLDRTLELTSGWYVVAGKVSRDSLAINGNVHLILMDDCELTASGGNRLAGVVVSPGNSIVIYGQKNGSGKLTAMGGEYGAGIGGGEKGAGGTVTINGGTVTATGGDWAAGIGGGDRGAGGTVTINGGRLKVVAGSEASVIGAGWRGGSPGSVAISDGIFAWKPNESWLVDISSTFFDNPDASTCADYPWAVVPAARVTFGRELTNVTATWTHGDGSVTSTIDGNSFLVPKGVSGIKVIFTPEDRYAIDKTEYVFAEAINADFEIPAKDLPTVTYLYAVVTVQCSHMTASWTCGDGSVTNAVSGTSFEVLKGTTGCQVIFAPEHNYQFVDADETGVRLLDSPLKEDCAVTPPEVEGIPGTDVAPWQVGKDVTAYVSDEGVLVIEGTGVMDDFASIENVPWTAIADEVTAVKVAGGVTLGKNALAELSDNVLVTFGSPVLSVGSMKGAMGGSEPVIPEDMVLVSKAEIEAAKATTIQVVDGTAYLDVNVSTNADLTAEIKSWGKVKLDPATVKQAEDGHGLVVPVPAKADKGFMILRSGDGR